MTKKSTAGMLTIPLHKAIDAALESKRDARGGHSVPASMIAHECERALWYSFIWAQLPEFEGRTLRRFDTGHAMEARIVEYLRDTGFEVHCENPHARNRKGQYGAEYKGGLIRGYVDGFIRGTSTDGSVQLGNGTEWHLLEVKAMASAKYLYADDDDTYSTPLANRDPIKHPTRSGNAPNIEGRWWETKRRGVKAVHRTHYGQLQCYMGISHELDAHTGRPNWQRWQLDGPLTRALYVAVNTDTEQIHAELIEYEPIWWKAAKARARRIARHRGNGPERVKESPMWPPCSFCDHRDICHRGDPVMPSCRSCVHAEIMLPGDPKYHGKRLQWACGKHGHGCGDFKACDDYQAIEHNEAMF